MQTTGLPSYVPLIHHGYGRAREEGLTVDATVAAISIKDVFRERHDGRLDVVADDPIALRRHFGLRDDAQVLLVCVANDRHLERYWAFRKVDAIPARLARLGFLGVTLPNFSFFLDAPRTHTMWNRSRMLRAGEELSGAGLAVVPHLNALTVEDWRFWKDFLVARPEISVVAKEFQTGLREKDKAEGAITALRDLVAQVDRPLHLVAVGATRHLHSLKTVFRSVTFVDSAPFIRTMKRRRCSAEQGRPRWRNVTVSRGPGLADLLNSNIRTHAAFINRTVSHIARSSRPPR
jgi:hypothetical protein